VTLLHEVSLFFVYGYKKLISIIDSRDVINVIVHKAIKLPEEKKFIEITTSSYLTGNTLRHCNKVQQVEFPCSPPNDNIGNFALH
jgi:hypothetical protein